MRTVGMIHGSKLRADKIEFWWLWRWHIKRCQSSKCGIFRYFRILPCIWHFANNVYQSLTSAMQIFLSQVNLNKCRTNCSFEGRTPAGSRNFWFTTHWRTNHAGRYTSAKTEVKVDATAGHEVGNGWDPASIKLFSVEAFQKWLEDLNWVIDRQSE